MITLKNKIEATKFALDVFLLPGSLARRLERAKFESKKEKNGARLLIYSMETFRIFAYGLLAYSIYERIAS